MTPTRPPGGAPDRQAWPRHGEQQDPERVAEIRATIEQAELTAPQERDKP